MEGKTKILERIKIVQRLMEFKGKVRSRTRLFLDKETPMYKGHRSQIAIEIRLVEKLFVFKK